MEISRVTSKGQITIPVEIRKKLNLKTGDEVVFIEDGDRVIGVVIMSRSYSQGSRYMKNARPAPPGHW